MFEKKCKKYIKVEVGKIKIETYFVLFLKCSLNVRAHALLWEPYQVSISNFVKFLLQIMSFKIERALQKNPSKLG